jgi:HNH endonuclease
MDRRATGHAIGRRAHIVIWEFFNGPRPDPDSDLHHRCRTRCCVNPSHLELLTPQEHHDEHPTPLKEFCAQGHALTEENRHHGKSGDQCRICYDEGQHRYSSSEKRRVALALWREKNREKLREQARNWARKNRLKKFEGTRVQRCGSTTEA